MLEEVSLMVDGHPVTLMVELGDSLLRGLRAAGHTQVTGACEQGECGSCSVVLDGRLVASCLVAAVTCSDADARTAPGLVGADLAEALARHGAVQCGFCTPGVVVAAEASIGAAIDAGRALPAGAVREALAGNLCRCTGYEGIVAAVAEVAAARSAAAAGPGVGTGGGPRP
jgi:carbon-monoxide dehydrogenase small subunit